MHSLALYNKNEGKSPHTLNEIYWNGKWVVVDPWMNVVFIKDGELLSKEDIIKDNSILRCYGYPENITSDNFKDSEILKPFPMISFNEIFDKIEENKQKVIKQNSVNAETLIMNLFIQDYKVKTAKTILIVLKLVR